MTDRLEGIDLVVFDKDGTLIEFHAMWSRWAADLATALETATGMAIADDLFEMLGYDLATGRAIGGGRLAATPMARIRDLTTDLLIRSGLGPAAAASAMEAAWHAPDPITLAHPVTDLPRLLAAIRSTGRIITVATADDRWPTLRTFEALGLTGLVDAAVCADDGVAPKPAPDMVVHLCARFGIEPSRAIVVGDSVADLTMGRAAGVARCFGVLTGVGSRGDLGPFADEILDSVDDLLNEGPGG